MQKNIFKNIGTKLCMLLFILCSSFVFSQTLHANLLEDLEIMEDSYNYSISDDFEIGENLEDLIDRFAYSKIFELDNVESILGEIKDIFEENKDNNKGFYFLDFFYQEEEYMTQYEDGEINFEQFFELSRLEQYANLEKILGELGYDVYDTEYQNYEKRELFSSYHELSPASIELSDTIEGLYFGYNFAEVDYDDNDFNYSTLEKAAPKNLYFKGDIEEITFEEISPESLSEGREINIFDYIDKIDKDIRYSFQYNYYLKVGENYIGLLNYYGETDFYFESYNILSKLKQDYNYERGITSNYIAESKQDFSVYEATFERIFTRYKSGKSESDYLVLLNKVKVLALEALEKTDKESIADTVINEETYETAYLEYSKSSVREEILKALLFFIHTESVKLGLNAEFESLID